MSENIRVVGSGVFVRATFRQHGLDESDPLRATNHYRYVDFDGTLDELEAWLKDYLKSKTGAEPRPFRRRFINRRAKARRSWSQRKG